MKKILIALVLIICIFMFAGCSSRPAVEDSNQYAYFIKITEYEIMGTYTIFMYDPVTKIIYTEIRAGYHAGFSTYYTIVNGKPEIAIYGVNWTEADLMEDVK